MHQQNHAYAHFKHYTSSSLVTFNTVKLKLQPNLEKPIKLKLQPNPKKPTKCKKK